MGGFPIATLTHRLARPAHGLRNIAGQIDAADAMIYRLAKSPVE